MAPNEHSQWPSLQQHPIRRLGSLGRVENPAGVTLAAAESTWDWNGVALSANLGNGLVWPSYPNSACVNWWQDGWTRYIPAGKSSGAKYADQSRIAANPNLQGIAVFSFCDGQAMDLGCEAPLQQSTNENA